MLLPALLAHSFWGFFARWLGWLGLLAGIALYCRRPWQRLNILGRSLTPSQRLVAALWVPVIRATGDLAKMAGYPVGVWWRWRHRRSLPPSTQEHKLTEDARVIRCCVLLRVYVAQRRNTQHATRNHGNRWLIWPTGVLVSNRGES